MAVDLWGCFACRPISVVPTAAGSAAAAVVRSLRDGDLAGVVEARVVFSVHSPLSFSFRFSFFKYSTNSYLLFPLIFGLFVSDREVQL